MPEYSWMNMIINWVEALDELVVRWGKEKDVLLERLALIALCYLVMDVLDD